jgi:hypothetical protein
MTRTLGDPNTQGPFGNTLLHSAVLSGADLLARSEDHLERLLDQALEATFPASDPIAVSPIPA